MASVESPSDPLDDLIISIMTEIDVLCNISEDAALSTEDVTSQHRLHCVRSLARMAKERKIDVMTSEKAVTEELSSVLQEDVKTLEKLKLEKALALQEDEKMLESLQKQLALLREGKAVRQVQGEMKATDDAQVVLRKAKRLFRDIRDDLDAVLEVLLGNDPIMKSLILEVTTAYFSKDDIYVDVKDKEWLPKLELLLRGKIITFHPYNKRKIRLAALE